MAAQKVAFIFSAGCIQQTGCKTSIGFRDPIFPFSEKWPANHNVTLFLNLLTNYLKNSEQKQKTYVNTPPSGIF